MIKNPPLGKKNIILKKLGEEIMLYDSNHDVVHVLNNTARVVWELADGKHNLLEIEGELKKRFSLGKDKDIMEDILKTINEFDEKGLLE